MLGSAYDQRGPDNQGYTVYYYNNIIIYISLLRVKACPLNDLHHPSIIRSAEFIQ